MSEQLRNVSLAPYWDVLYRHRLSLCCTLVVGLLLTALAVVMLPDVYQSTTLVTIEPQEVPAQYVSAGVTSHIQDRLKILSEKALSRTQLERLINKFKLYPERRADYEMENLVSYLRSRVDIDVTKEDDQAGSGSFELAFEYSDPVLAQKVTAALADGFIAEDRRGRQQQAAATTAFLEDRLNIARGKLDAKAGEIKAFKNRYQGSLPQDLQVNLTTLETLQGRLQSGNEAQLALDERRAQLGREMADARTLAAAAAANGGAPLSPRARLAAAEAQLAEMRVRYSDQYPDVISLKAQVAALKQQLKAGGGATQSDADLAEEVDPGFRRESDSIAIEQQRVVADNLGVKRDIARYQQRIAETPAHQQEYDSLNRDYSVLNAEYHSLLNKRLAAQAAQSLEERGEGEHFRVIDPANLPLSAERPDKTAIAVGGVLLSLLAAVGIAFFRFFLDTSFKQPEEVVRELGLPVAVTIPQFDQLSGRWAQRAALLRAAASSALIVLLGASAIWIFAAHRL